MAYTPYAEYSDYIDMGLDEFGSEEEITEALKMASRHIDTLTYNRIVAIGFDNLTEFQKGVIKDVVCRQALFEHNNVDELNSILKGYSVNGVSADYGDSLGVQTKNGITMSRSLYSLLEQTGLCCQLARFVWRNTRN